MRSHLLNWTIGPAFLGALFGSFGCPPQAPPAATDWLSVLRTIAGIAIFFSVAGLILMAIMVVGSWLVEGRLMSAQVRLFAKVMAVKIAMLIFALALLISVSQVAVIVFGSWPPGWTSAVVGALIGAAVGLPIGLLVAWLKIPQRLGIIPEQ